MASLARPTANRAVHLRITPRPSNLGESREIMRLISQFGEVEYFKNLKYDALSHPNAALVIYKEESAAKECLRRSPIRFRMGRVRQQRKPYEDEDGTRHQGEENTHIVRKTKIGVKDDNPRGPLGTPFGLSSPQTRSLSTSSLPTPPPNQIYMPFDPPPPADPEPAADVDESRLFQIITNTCNRHFRDQINMGHYHGGFAIDSKMPGHEDLAKKVPIPGLSCVDWKAVGRPWRVIAAEKSRMGGSGRLGLLAGQDGRSADETMGKWSDEGEAEVEQDVNAEIKAKEDGEEDSALSNIAKGWEQFFPSIASEHETVERYSRRPK